MATLRLGHVDAGNLPRNKKEFLEPYHPFMTPELKNMQKFRDEANTVWRSFKEVQGGEVKQLQGFLKKAGFMPKSNVSGIFGYGTAAAARLFQHYMRFVEGKDDIGTPDGVIGRKTWNYIKNWEQNHPDKICEWGAASTSLPSPGFEVWLDLIKKGKGHFGSTSDPIIDQTEAFKGKTDTRKVADWDTNPNSIHLIGIRRGEEFKDKNAVNNDLFVLLINGMVFYFWGSTDPNPYGKYQHSSGMAFLCEGQHKYEFGWHRVGDKKKIYRALRPPNHGVLIFRDRDKDHKLTTSDRQKKIEPNTTINIHWSGIGTLNYSAGCQVISGKSYMTGQGKLVDCSDFAATKYADLGGKTRGAYDILVDLILTYAQPGVTSISYTLAKDDAIFLSDGITKDMLGDIVERMRG